MNAHIRRTFYLFVAGFVALVGVLAYWQVYARESLANSPDNSLQTRRSIEAPRGLILARDGETVLARSVRRQTGDDVVYDRVYPQGEIYSNVVGYWSSRYGATGIEIGENSNLSGTAEPATVDDLINEVSGGPRTGNNVTLTLDPELQRLSYDLIARSETGRGSAVVLDPNNGEVLAMVSVPSYDPNNIDDNFQDLVQGENSPLVNKATQGLYPPGSVFKVITAAAALKSGVEPSDTFFDNGTYQRPGYKVVNYGDANYGRVTFARALELSINTVFAKIAVERVGARTLFATARDFGFDDSFEEFPLEVRQSILGDGDIAQLAFGQGTVLSNTLIMALATSAIANDGTMMEPRIVQEVRSPDGVIIDRPSPRAHEESLDPETANTLQRMMVGVVEEGTATSAQLQGVQVAGKTGTAEVDTRTSGGSVRAPHSWFITSAPAGDPQVAVAVLIENGGDGEKAALPVARQIIEAYLGREGEARQDRPGGRRSLPEIPRSIRDNLPENPLGEN
jgi:peptidoglycan glycosyltransferase